MAAPERRHGKWTTAECDYAMLLIEHFTSGRLPGLLGGESLRATLAECLACTPMRVTKKLSATHAIGKCCFQKRGELEPREKAELDAARRAFLASAEARRRPSAVGDAPRQPVCDRVTRQGGAKKRKSHPDDEAAAAAAVAADDAADDDAWLAAPAAPEPAERVAPHDVAAGGPVETSVMCRVNAQRRTAVRLVVADRPGLLGHMSRFFSRRNLTVQACRAETLAGGVAHDEFEVLDARTRRPVSDPARLAALEAEVLESLRGLERDKSAATTLSVSVPDRPGLLKQITASLTALRLSIVGAKISTVGSGGPGKTAVDTFDVVDALSGGPVLDPARLRAIEAQLARDLEETPSAAASAAGDEASGSGAPSPHGASAESSSPSIQITSESPPPSRSASVDQGEPPKSPL